MPRSGRKSCLTFFRRPLPSFCEGCRREGRYNVARLIAKHGDAALTDLLSFLSVKCPKTAFVRIHDRCKAHYGPMELRSALRPNWDRRGVSQARGQTRRVGHVSIARRRRFRAVPWPDSAARPLAPLAKVVAFFRRPHS